MRKVVLNKPTNHSTIESIFYLYNLNVVQLWEIYYEMIRKSPIAPTHSSLRAKQIWLLQFIRLAAAMKLLSVVLFIGLLCTIHTCNGAPTDEPIDNTTENPIITTENVIGEQDESVPLGLFNRMKSSKKKYAPVCYGNLQWSERHGRCLPSMG